jgi:AAA ATPase domain
MAQVLVGRDAERVAIAALLEAARGSSGGALVIRGVAGSGKSALLADAAAAAADMTVLRTQGVESESPLAFAALQRLLWPLRKGAGGLPAPQRAALQAAFGEVEGEGDRFLAFLGTLSLLADAAEERPVLVIADDAHWLDEASANALLFVARRLQAERVALLFAARDGVASGFDAGELPCLTLGGLSGESAGQLLRGHAPGDVDAAVRDQLVAATAGNPLALGELAEVLSGDQLSGRDPLPEQLPLTGGVERAFLDRYRRLPEAAQRFLLVAATDDTARLPVIRDASARLDAGDDALDTVEQAGLLRVDGDVVTLYHPLVRSAVYRAATSAQRRAAHRALADALGGDADRRAWHLAAASDRPDDAVAGALDAVAGRATARGGHEAAAAAWSRASELTADPAGRARRLATAAHAACYAAQPARARALADAARPDAADPLLRADLDRLRARVDWNVGSTLVGHRILLQAARDVAPVDAERARAMTMVAAALATFVGEGADDMSAQAATLGDVTAATSDSARCYARLLAGFVHVRNGQFAEAAAQFRPALADCDPGEDTDLRANLGIAAFHLGDDRDVQAHHTRLLTDARESGALALIVHALTRRACGDVAAGDWDALAAGAAEALDLAGSSGQPALTRFPHGWLALLAALRDQRAQLAGHLQAIEAPAQRRGHRPPGRRPRPVGPCPDRGDAGPHAAPPRADDHPHDTTGGARPHRGRRPRRARRPGSRLVSGTPPVRRGGRVGLGACRRRIWPRAAIR